MKLKRESTLFVREYEMTAFCAALESRGYRLTELATQTLHRSYSVQCWNDAAAERQWRVEWHAHANDRA